MMKMEINLYEYIEILVKNRIDTLLREIDFKEYKSKNGYLINSIFLDLEKKELESILKSRLLINLIRFYNHKYKENEIVVYKYLKNFYVAFSKSMLEKNKSLLKNNKDFYDVVLTDKIIKIDKLNFFNNFIKTNELMFLIMDNLFSNDFNKITKYILKEIDKLKNNSDEIKKIEEFILEKTQDKIQEKKDEIEKIKEKMIKTTNDNIDANEEHNKNKRLNIELNLLKREKISNEKKLEKIDKKFNVEKAKVLKLESKIVKLKENYKDKCSKNKKLKEKNKYLEDKIKKENLIIKNKELISKLNKLKENNNSKEKEIRKLKKSARVDAYIKTVENENLENAIICAIKKSKKEILINIPWISERVINITNHKYCNERYSPLFEALDEKIRSGKVEVHINYGIKAGENFEKENEKYNTTKELIQYLNQLYKDYPKFKTLEVNTHAKVIICDAKILIDGSLNFLTYTYDNNFFNKRGESGTIITYKPIVEEKRRTLFSKFNRIT